MWEYFSSNSKSIDEFLILIFTSWGIAYVIFLWISFFVSQLETYLDVVGQQLKRG